MHAQNVRDVVVFFEVWNCTASPRPFCDRKAAIYKLQPALTTNTTTRGLIISFVKSSACSLAGVSQLESDLINQCSAISRHEARCFEHFAFPSTSVCTFYTASDAEARLFSFWTVFDLHFGLIFWVNRCNQLLTWLYSLSIAD